MAAADVQVLSALYDLARQFDRMKEDQTRAAEDGPAALFDVMIARAMAYEIAGNVTRRFAERWVDAYSAPHHSPAPAP